MLTSHSSVTPDPDASEDTYLYLVGAVALIFGQGLLISLQDGMGHTGLTGNALNYNWLVTYFLSSTQPERFGSIADGIVNLINIFN